MYLSSKNNCYFYKVFFDVKTQINSIDQIYTKLYYLDNNLTPLVNGDEVTFSFWFPRLFDQFKELSHLLALLLNKC